MIRMQNEDAVHGARQHRVHLVVFRRHGKAHVQEVFRVGQLVARIHEGLAHGVLVGHGRDRRHLGDQAAAGDHPLLGIIDVGRVVIEGRQGTDDAGHDGHRVRVTAEAAIEVVQLLMHHGVIGDGALELLILAFGRQFAFQQQVAGLDEVALLGQLVDRVAAVQQHAGLAVDEGDLAFAARR